MMEREIRFRGKTKDGNWAYGYYLPWHAVRDTAGKDVYGQIFEEHKKKDKYIPKGWITVIDNTIGQYTGLKDKNGVEIYEGDVVAVKLNGKTIDIGDVQFDCGLFGVEWTRAKKDKSMVGSWGQRHNLRRLDDDFIEYFEVVGNIYDNPELIGE